MAKEAGVVKSVNGGIARALNDLTGEVRQLSVGDIVYQGEKIVTEGSNSKVTITQTDGKDITLIGKDTLTLDQDSNNNETVADISALQQAILKGTDLNALEETAAGGPQAGGNGGDGVSLSSTSFAEGGHISNINANVGSIDALSLAAGGDNSFGVSGGSAVGAGAIEPTLPAGSIKIPLSAYVGESTSSRLLASFYNSIPNGYHVYRHTDGRDYLTPDDPTTPSAFQHKDGWYVSNDGKLAIGQDDAKDLAVTSTAKASNYPDDGSVAKIVNPNPSLKVFGSDNIDNITVDGAQIASVLGGVGNDNVDLKNGAKVFGVSGGSGSDNITVEGGSKVDTLLGDNKTKNDVHEKAYQASQGKNIDIEDNGAAGDTIKVSGNGTQVRFIGAGNGDDDITVDKGAKVGLIQADEGNDKVTVSDSGTYVSGINGRGGDDEILVEKGAKVDGIVGRWGNDKITVKDTGTVVTENIEGNEDSDTIKILDGAKVKGYVSGGRGESPSIYGGAADSDKDNITVENSTVEGVVEGGIWGGNDEMKIKNSHIGGISGGNGENKIDISNVTNLDAKTVWGNKFKDIINIDGTLINSEIKTIEGEDIVNINAGATINKIDINTGADKDTVNINANITADVGNQSNIMTEGGIDKVNIASGVTLTSTVINTGAGEETIKINDGKTANGDRIVFDSSSLNTGADNDIVEVTNTTFMNSNNRGLSELRTDDGDDRITIKEGTIFQDASYVFAGNGNDTITLESGAKFIGGNVYAHDGDDKVYVNGAEFTNGGVNGGAGDDEIYINDGSKFDNGNIRTETGNDKIFINKGANLMNNTVVEAGAGDDEITIEKGAILNDTKIDGGAGFDTLKVADNSIDFSHVKNIEKLDMTNGEKTTLTLTAGNVQDILRDSNENKLKIDGDSNDELTLGSSWTKGASSGGYTTYTSGTTTIEVQDQIHVL